VPETKTPFRIRPLTIVFVAAALVLVVVAVVYLTMSHPKHALLFFGLAVLALVGAWFSTGDARLGRGTER
jgi:NADH:ubiquinone oxidoreductase subunit 6 (subunit J)